MSDDPTVRGPIPDPEPEPPAEPGLPESVAPVPGDPLPPEGIGSGASQIALGAIVFVAAFLLLLGATRLLERGSGPTASPASSLAASASLSPSPSGSPSPAPSGSASLAPSGSPTGSASASGSPSGSAGTNATPTPPGDPVLVGAGDIGDCESRGDEATAKLLDQFQGTIFTAGDNAYGSGTAAQFRDCYGPTWGRHKERTRPAPGNHDWETDGLAGYREYFGAAAQGPDGSSWYSYDLATWHVIVLDSTCDKVGGCDPSSPQGTWLAADLAANRTTCTLAIFHHPRFSSGEHGNLPTMDAFWRPLYAAGVDLVVNGHDHDYERFALQDPDGRLDDARGIREIVVGTGGTLLRDFGRPVANSEVRQEGVHGVLALTLHAGGYDWTFIGAGTELRDQGTTGCH